MFLSNQTAQISVYWTIHQSKSGISFCPVHYNGHNHEKCLYKYPSQILYLLASTVVLLIIWKGLSLLISGNAMLMPSAGCWMLDPPAVSSITVITDTFCTHNDAGIEQKMNIIVPIIISSHLPQSSQPSPCLTGLLAITTTLRRERRQLVTGASFIFIFGPRASLTDQLFEAILSNQ